MIVSHKYRFIYLKGHKVAGSSILLSAGRYCGPDDMVHRPAQGNPPVDTWSEAEWGAGRNTDGLPREPIPEVLIAKIGQGTWDEYFKFTVVRNPWDLLLSSYCWRVYMETGQTHIKDIDVSAFRNFAASRHMDMEKNVKRSVSGEKLLLDYYIRFEQLVADYKTVCEKISMPYIDPPRLKSTIRATRQHYSSYYDAATRDAVYERYRAYIEAFGYSFEEP